jgi:hypothetical protein
VIRDGRIPIVLLPWNPMMFGISNGTKFNHSTSGSIRFPNVGAASQNKLWILMKWAGLTYFGFYEHIALNIPCVFLRELASRRDVECNEEF